MLEMPVPSQGHYGFHSFPVVTDFVCLYNYEFWLSLCKIIPDFVCLYTYEFWLSLCKIAACTKSGSLRFSQFSGCWRFLFIYLWVL